MEKFSGTLRDLTIIAICIILTTFFIKKFFPTIETKTVVTRVTDSTMVRDLRFKLDSLQARISFLEVDSAHYAREKRVTARATKDAIRFYLAVIDSLQNRDSTDVPSMPVASADTDVTMQALVNDIPVDVQARLHLRYEFPPINSFSAWGELNPIAVKWDATNTVTTNTEQVISWPWVGGAAVAGVVVGILLRR